jgi:hypothetical protein
MGIIQLITSLMASYPESRGKLDWIIQLSIQSRRDPKTVRRYLTDSFDGNRQCLNVIYRGLWSFFITACCQTEIDICLIVFAILGFVFRFAALEQFAGTESACKTQLFQFINAWHIQDIGHIAKPNIVCNKARACHFYLQPTLRNLRKWMQMYLS